MPILAPRQVQILLPEPTLDALAERMPELASEASGLTVPCRQRVCQVIRQHVTDGTALDEQVLRQLRHGYQSLAVGGQPGMQKHCPLAAVTLIHLRIEISEIGQKIRDADMLEDPPDGPGPRLKAPEDRRRGGRPNPATTSFTPVHH
jgi:hypothetical protein